MPNASPPADGVAAFRDLFPIFEQKIYLSSCSQGALARPVEAAFRSFLDSWHEHGNPWELWVGEMEKLRGQFARLVNAGPHEIAVTYSVSTGLNSLASSMDYSGRPTVVMSDFDFPTMGHVWLAQERRGARVRFARAEGRRMPISSYEEAVGPDTALVATTHVCYKNGFKTNPSALAELAHERGALLLIDAYQSMGTQPMDVKALELDFLVTGALKYLLGSPGIGFMYVREDLVERFKPSDSGWFGQRNVFAYDVHRLEYAGSARRFETGSPPIPNIYAALAALRLIEQVGLERIQRHVEELAGRLIDGIQSRGLDLLTPSAPAERGPLVMVGIDRCTKTGPGPLRSGHPLFHSRRGSAHRASLLQHARGRRCCPRRARSPSRAGDASGLETIDAGCPPSCNRV